MKNEFEISCVLTVYKGTNVTYLEEALDSIYNQTFLPSELIVVVDGPVGFEIENFLSKLISKDNRVELKVHRLAENKGPAIARNSGAEVARCEYIAIMDSDDVNRFDRFEKQINLFKEFNDISICGGLISEFSKNKNDLDSIRSVPIKESNFLGTLKFRSPINNVTAMIKKEALLSVGGYPDKRTSEDYELWVNLYNNGFKFKNINSVMVDVRLNDINLSNRDGFNVFKDDISTQKLLLDCKLINIYEFLRNLFLYSFFRFVPLSLKSYILKIILRK